MTEQDESWAVLDFLGQWHADREQGRMLGLAEYLRRFPGHEEAIAREWAELTRQPETGPGDARCVGPYELIGELGRGGQGEVWLALDPRLSRKVALKLLREPGGELRSNARFLREATLASKIEHPGVCRIYEVGESDGLPWIAMQYVEGESLAAKLAAHAAGGGSGPVPLPERRLAREDRTASRSASQRLVLPSPAEEPLWDVLALAEEIARALHAAHEQGVVHRDLKPANVIVTPRGRPVVLDFGLARDTEPGSVSLTISGSLFGTPSYMAPEQIDGREATPRTDVWALGVVLYELIAGVPPFVAASQQKLFDMIRTEEPAPLQRQVRGISRDLRAVLGMALEKDPKHRYASCAALADDLAALQAKEPVLARLPGPVLRTLRWAERNRIVASLLVLVFGLLVFGLWRESLARREEEALRGVAEQRSAELRELVGRVLYDYQAALRDVPGALAANQRIAQETLRFLELLDQDGGRARPADLVSARLLAGDLLGDVERPHLGRWDEAQAHYRAALAELPRIEDEATRALLEARLHGRLARLDAESGELGRALEGYARATALLAGRSDPEARREAAALWVAFGVARQRDRTSDEREAAALDAVERGLAAYRALEEGSAEGGAEGGAEAGGERRLLRVDHAWALLRASDLQAVLGRREESAQRFAAAHERFRTAEAEGERGTRRVLGQARCELRQAMAWMASRANQQAEAAFATALGRLRDLLRVDPQNEHARRALAIALTDRGYAWSQLGQKAEALRCYREAIETGEAASRAIVLEEELVRARLFEAELHYTDRDYERAYAGFEALRRASAARYARDPEDLDALRHRATGELYAAKSLQRLGRDDEALAALGSVLADYRELRDKRPSDPRIENGLRSALQTRGFAMFGKERYDEARADFEAALAISPGEEHARTRGILWISQANVLLRQGREPETLEALARAESELTQALDQRPGDVYALRNHAEAVVLRADLELRRSERGEGPAPALPPLVRLAERLRVLREAHGVQDTKLLLMEANLAVLHAALEPAGAARGEALDRTAALLALLPEGQREAFALAERYAALRGSADARRE